MHQRLVWSIRICAPKQMVTFSTVTSNHVGFSIWQRPVMVAKAGSLYLFMSHVVLLSGLKNTWVSGGEVVLLFRVCYCTDMWVFGASENPLTVSHCHRIKSQFLDDLHGFLWSGPFLYSQMFACSSLSELLGLCAKRSLFVEHKLLHATCLTLLIIWDLVYIISVQKDFSDHPRLG